MRSSSTVVCLLAAAIVVASAGCHSTGVWNSPSWTTSSFNPATWHMGPNPSSSLASAPPAKPSLTSAPTFPSTADASKLAASGAVPKEYPTTAAGYNIPGGNSPAAALLPQQGRYGDNNQLAANPMGGYNNPAYETPAGSPAGVENPYRVTAPAVPGANGSLASPAQQKPVDSRYQASIALRSNAPASSYYSDDQNAMPKVVGGYPSTSATASTISTGTMTASSGNMPAGSATPDNRYPAYPATAATVNAAVPANSFPQGSSWQQGNSNPNYPVTSPSTTTPPSVSYQPGANGYTPGANQNYTPGNNGYTPGVNGYQVPTTGTAPVQSGQSYNNNYGYNGASTNNSPQMAPLAPSAAAGNTAAAPFRPGSTGGVEEYPWTSSPQSNSPASAYPSTQSNYPAASPGTQPASPVRTSINTSNVMPVGFDQDAQLWR